MIISSEKQLKDLIFIFSKPSDVRSTQDIDYLVSQTQMLNFFQEYIQKGQPDIHRRCMQVMTYEYYKKDSIVFNLGNFIHFVCCAVGNKFYVILSGSVGVYIKANEGQEQTDPNSSVELTCVKTLTAGQAFGEIALMNLTLRLATIKCNQDCHFAILEKRDFRQILKKYEEEKLLKEMGILGQLPFFKDFQFEELRQIYLNSFVLKFKRNERVFREGDASNQIYIVKSGEFAIFKQILVIQDETSRQSCLKKPMDYLKYAKFHQKYNPKDFRNLKIYLFGCSELIGEEDIIKQQNRQFSLICYSGEGELIMINKKDFLNRIFQKDAMKIYFEQRLKNKEECYEDRVRDLLQSINKLDTHNQAVNEKKYLIESPLRQENSKDKAQQTIFPTDTSVNARISQPLTFNETTSNQQVMKDKQTQSITKFIDPYTQQFHAKLSLKYYQKFGVEDIENLKSIVKHRAIQEFPEEEYASASPKSPRRMSMLKINQMNKQAQNKYKLWHGTIIKSNKSDEQAPITNKKIPPNQLELLLMEDNQPRDALCDKLQQQQLPETGFSSLLDKNQDHLSNHNKEHKRPNLTVTVANSIKTQYPKKAITGQSQQQQDLAENQRETQIQNNIIVKQNCSLEDIPPSPEKSPIKKIKLKYKLKERLSDRNYITERKNTQQQQQMSNQSCEQEQSYLNEIKLPNIYRNRSVENFYAEREKGEHFANWIADKQDPQINQDFQQSFILNQSELKITPKCSLDIDKEGGGTMAAWFERSNSHKKNTISPPSSSNPFEKYDQIVLGRVQKSLSPFERIMLTSKISPGIKISTFNQNSQNTKNNFSGQREKQTREATNNYINNKLLQKNQKKKVISQIIKNSAFNHKVNEYAIQKVRSISTVQQQNLDQLMKTSYRLMNNQTRSLVTPLIQGLTYKAIERKVQLGKLITNSQNNYNQKQAKQLEFPYSHLNQQ